MKKFIIPMATAAMTVGIALAPTVSAINPTSITEGGQLGLACTTAGTDEKPIYNCELQAQDNGETPRFDFVVAANETLNLNLNGQTLTNWTEPSSSTIWVQKGGTATITDPTGEGTIGSRYTQDNTPVIANDGTLTIEGGIISTNRQGASAIYNTSDLTISGGKIDVTANADADELESASWGITNTETGNLTITGGEFNQEATVSLIQNQGVLDIQNGTFETTKEGANAMITNDKELSITGGNFTSDNVITNGENATALISGGTFSDPTAVTEYLASGVEFNADGTVVAKAETPTETPTEETTENPNTADPIALYATVAVLAVLGLGATAVVAKKSNR